QLKLIFLRCESVQLNDEPRLSLQDLGLAAEAPDRRERPGGITVVEGQSPPHVQHLGQRQLQGEVARGPVFRLVGDLQARGAGRRGRGHAQRVLIELQKGSQSLPLGPQGGGTALTAAARRLFPSGEKASCRAASRSLSPALPAGRLGGSKRLASRGPVTPSSL